MRYLTFLLLAGLPLPASRPSPTPPCRIGLLVTASGPGRGLALALREVSLAPAQGDWVRLAGEKESKRLAGWPAPVLAQPAPARLVALGAVPAGVYERVRLALVPGGGSCLLPAEEQEAGVPLALATPALELACPALTLAPGDLRYLVLTVDLGKVEHPGGACRLPARALRLAEPAPELLGGIAGEVAPPAALATVQACLAATDAALATAKSDPVTGSYTLPGLPPGAYYLAVQAPGYRRVQDRAHKLAVQPQAVTPAPRVVLEPAGEGR